MQMYADVQGGLLFCCMHLIIFHKQVLRVYVGYKYHSWKAGRRKTGHQVHIKINVFVGLSGSFIYIFVFNETLSQKRKASGEYIPNMSLLFPCLSFNAF